MTSWDRSGIRLDSGLRSEDDSILVGDELGVLDITFQSGLAITDNSKVALIFGWSKQGKTRFAAKGSNCE